MATCGDCLCVCSCPETERGEPRSRWSQRQTDGRQFGGFVGDRVRSCASGLIPNSIRPGLVCGGRLRKSTDRGENECPPTGGADRFPRSRPGGRLGRCRTSRGADHHCSVYRNTPSERFHWLDARERLPLPDGVRIRGARRRSRYRNDRVAGVTARRAVRPVDRRTDRLGLPPAHSITDIVL